MGTHTHTHPHTHTCIHIHRHTIKPSTYLNLYKHLFMSRSLVPLEHRQGTSLIGECSWIPTEQDPGYEEADANRLCTSNTHFRLLPTVLTVTASTPWGKVVLRC